MNFERCGGICPDAPPLDPPVYVATIIFFFNARMSFATLLSLAEVLHKSDLLRTPLCKNKSY